MKLVKDDRREQIKLEKRLQKMLTSPHVAVGVLQDEPVDDEFTMVDLAVVHEYGSDNGHIPARSFLRSMLDAKKAEHLKLIAKLQDDYVMNKKSMHQALTIFGLVVAADIKQTIIDGIDPPIAKETVRRKKNSTKQLIDTGHLKGSITHQVRGV